MSTQQFSDADRFGCEGCPDNPENREYMQQRGVSVSGVDGRPKGNPVLEAIDDAIQPESGGITTEQHNEMLDYIRAAYLQQHPQVPEVTGRTTSYYICPQCKTPIDMSGTGLDGLVAPGDGGEFYGLMQQYKKAAETNINIRVDRAAAFKRILQNLQAAHNDDRAADKKRIAELEAQLASAQKPRVMKRWGVDGVPPGMGEYWIMREGEKGPVVKILLSSEAMNGKDMHTKFTHWLELEPVPTLPETNGDMIAGDGD